jgi:Bacterial SCP ortholog
MPSLVDPRELAAAINAVTPWLAGAAGQPERPVLAAAVRLSLRTLAQDAPGKSVEVRVPPFAAVQCVEGVRHTRGTPPNVIETDDRTWLELATGLLSWGDALADDRVSASGSRADLAAHLPLVRART